MFVGRVTQTAPSVTDRALPTAHSATLVSSFSHNFHSVSLQRGDVHQDFTSTSHLDLANLALSPAPHAPPPQPYQPSRLLLCPHLPPPPRARLAQPLLSSMTVPVCPPARQGPSRTRRKRGLSARVATTLARAVSARWTPSAASVATDPSTLRGGVYLTVLLGTSVTQLSGSVSHALLVATLAQNQEVSVTFAEMAGTLRQEGIAYHLKPGNACLECTRGLGPAWPVMPLVRPAMDQRRETAQPATPSIDSTSPLVFPPALRALDNQRRRTLAWPVPMPAAPVKGRAGALAANLATTSYLTLAPVSPPAGRPSSPRRTQPASPATEAAESALDPDPTTVSPALLITLSLQVPAFPPAHQANTRCLVPLPALVATPPVPPAQDPVQQLAPPAHPLPS